MTPELHDILEANIPYGNAKYSRPCVVMSKVVNRCVVVIPISSAMELFNGLPFHFTIEDTDPNFRSTGLTRTSYCAGDELRDLNVSEIIRKRGRLEGELLARFKKWID